ncbi:MAG: hypothetical protein ACQERU_11485 [Bacteroidota bacterium]
MTTKKITRGISREFTENFKKCELYELSQKHRDEIFIGVRNNYLNLYYNCDSIAKVEYKKGEITCKIDKYYLDGKHYTSRDKRMIIAPSEIYNNYKVIKVNSNKKATNEKKSQSKLVLLNNNNNNSNWHCFDVEWVKAFENQQQKDDTKFYGRFDIMAISKKKPHKVALIELKYGSGAIGGKSGIFKHIDDFKKYQDKSYYDKQEVKEIIEIQKMLGVSIPDELKDLKIEYIGGYKFYVITLNNNAERENGSTPKQTMSGYLFNDYRWNCKRISNKTVQTSFGDVTDINNSIHVNFLFSTQTLDNLTINDVLEHNDYE